jgi:hypothetical protein
VGAFVVVAIVAIVTVIVMPVPAVFVFHFRTNPTSAYTES